MPQAKGVLQNCQRLAGVERAVSSRNNSGCRRRFARVPAAAPRPPCRDGLPCLIELPLLEVFLAQLAQIRVHQLLRRRIRHRRRVNEVAAHPVDHKAAVTFVSQPVAKQVIGEGGK